RNPFPYLTDPMEASRKVQEQGAAGAVPGPRVDRATQVYRQLRELIVHGRLAPGARIIETEVASRLGVSRTPVRAALQRLQQEGYITVSGSGRQSRPSIAPLTREDARELFGIVGALEGLAARAAAGLEDRIRIRHVERLRAINEEYLRMSRERRSDENRLFALDTRFHRYYVEMGAGPRLLALHDAVKPQAERYVRLYISALVDEIATSVKEHRVIVEAIAAGDGPGAEQAVHTNWRNAAERLSRVIDTLGERGSW
ncbi:MAG TPA: GntR family transcriptional regulator, partial [Gemmatimonadales bacterium]|nr:GntR family transcriptional regulator [Gemmatimonadales bacterium]